MTDLNNNHSKFNLPTYINIPFFLYQDHRLEKSATLIAAFFYSLHTAGQKITASTDYLCALAAIHKRQLYYIMNQLEEYQYITRTGFTNRKKLQWVYNPKSSITVLELDTSALKDTSVQPLNTSAVNCSKLVQSSALNLCTPVHTDIKEDTKDNKKLTTVNPSSSSFFSEKQTAELLTYKLPTDMRSDDLFLQHCIHHVEKQGNDRSKYERFIGLKNILTKGWENKEPFKSSGLKQLDPQIIDNRIPTQEDWKNYTTCVPGYDWVWTNRQKQA